MIFLIFAIYNLIAGCFLFIWTKWSKQVGSYYEDQDGNLASAILWPVTGIIYTVTHYMETHDFKS